MKVLVIGRGGRESAIVKKTLTSKLVSKVYVAPGNAQTSNIANNVNIDELNISKLCEFAKNEEIDLTIVGPESSLEAGIVDEFISNGLEIFGPTKEACIIESSKSYAKQLMVKYKIPTAAYKEFIDSQEAIEYARNISYPHVIKYDGLAAGKGVVICNNFIEMKKQIRDMLEEKVFGNNSKVILEEFLEGEEFTLLSLVNQDKVYPLEVSRDFKRAHEGDEGLNTGGMGAICPFDKISNSEKKEAVDILKMTAVALCKENRKFVGILYGGFISTKNGVKVIEYNARFGDPETEVVLQKLKSDLILELLNLLNNKEVNIVNDDNYYLGVTLAAKGYPNSYEKGFEINSKELEEVFHMGTKLENGKVVSTGGRVLFISGSGINIEQARSNAYQKVDEFMNDNMFYRKDI